MKKWTKIAIGAGLLAAGAGGGLLCCGGPAPLKAGEITDSEETKRLDSGEVLLIEQTPTDGVGVAAIAKGVIEAPVAKVWPAVRDCAHFKEFMPRTVDSKLLSDGDEGMRCLVVIDMPWPISDLEAESLSTIEELPGGAYKRSWTLVKGSFTRNNGSYLVEPFKGDPNRSLLTYTVDVNPKIAIPDAILKAAQTGSLPEVFVKVGERVGAPPRKSD